MAINDTVQWIDDNGVTKTGVLKEFVNRRIQTREQLRTIAPLYRNDTIGIVLSESLYVEVLAAKLQFVP